MPGTTRALLLIVVGIILFAGFPACGWGIDDVAGFVAHPARSAYVALVCFLNVLVAVRMPRRETARRRPQTIVSRQRLAVVLLQVLSLLVVLVGPYCDRRNIAVIEGQLLRYVGLLAFTAGFLTLHWAETALGKQFSVQVAIQDGHQLVTTGPYRFLRHPRYLAILALTAGIGLVFRSWMSLTLVAALTAVLLWRIRDEEALLCQQFGSAWASYVSKSWRLVPFIY